MKRTLVTLLFIALMLGSTLLTGCAPAASTPNRVASQPKSTQPAAEKRVVERTQVVQATAAPAAREELPATPPPDNNFQDYGVNPQTNARRDHLSTFALDVDTASYTITRRYITEGNLPPIDAVRVEEFVNYFRQDYPAPRDMAFSVYADGAPSPFGPNNETILRFGIQGYTVSQSERQPLVLTFVIDVSGSMAEQNRLELVKQTADLLVNRLRSDDSVSVVAFTTRARLVLPPTSGSDRRRILNAINSLQPQNTTNVEDGLRLGFEQANQAYRSGATNRVIILTDGVANVGDTDAQRILDEVGDFAKSGIGITCIGVGMGNFNDVLLEQIADKSNGNYAYVDNMEESRRLFVDELTSTVQTIGRNGKVQVDFNTDVVLSFRQIGYENRAIADSDFRDDGVTGGVINAGHSVTALYAIQLKPGAKGRIATISLRWEDPTSGEVKEINGNINSWDMANTYEEASPRYQLDVAVAHWAEILRKSPYVKGYSIWDVEQHAHRISDQLREDPDAQEFADLVSRSIGLLDR
jgi:Ca-activated chloride channel family protein